MRLLLTGMSRSATSRHNDEIDVVVVADGSRVQIAPPKDLCIALD